jgi:hypothetical protein
MTHKDNSRGPDPKVSTADITTGDSSVEMLLARALKRQISYRGESRTKIEVILEEAVNRAIGGNFELLLKLPKIIDPLNRVNEIAKESKSPFADMDPTKMTGEELQAAIRGAIARSKPPLPKR